MTHEKVGEIMDWLDRRQRVASVTMLWENFPIRVCDRFEQLISKKGNKDRCSGRHQALVCRVYENQPKTGMLMWEQELFEAACDAVLPEVRTELWKHGEWQPDWQAKLAALTLPRVQLDVAWWRSRVTRPRMALPVERKEGIFAITPPIEGGEFDGWYKMASVERQLTYSDSALGECSGYIVAAVGAIFEDGPVMHPTSYRLFGQGTASEGWACPPDVDLSGWPLTGQSVGMENMEELTGTKRILMLAPPLTSLCGLRPGPWPGRLTMVDGKGFPAVVFRQWRVRPIGDQLDQATPQLSGCDLVVRPDIFERISSVMTANCRLVTQVFRDDLTEGETN